MLGQGAMGMVYKGYDVSIDRIVAIKTLHPYLLGGEYGKELRARFKREARAAARCLHPNIVTVFEYGEDRDIPYIAMEFVEGRELKRCFDQSVRFKIKDIADIILQVLDALQLAHSCGVVHRDIKPTNIILLENGRIKVADFGVARVDTSDMTQTGFMIGTPSYMSPEQLAGQPADCRSDLFSLGVVLFELLAGVKPFPSRVPTTTVHEVINATPDDPFELDDRIPAAFKTVVHKALARKLEDRFQTALEFADAVKVACKPDETADSGPKAWDSATLVAPSSRVYATKRSGKSTYSWEPAILKVVEENLVVHVGPVAQMLIRKVAQHAPNIEELYRMLAKQIPTEAERQLFLSKVQLVGRSSLPVAVATEEVSSGVRAAADTVAGAQKKEHFSPEVLKTAVEHLIIHVGPVADALVKRAAQKASTIQEFYQLLSDSIPTAQERMSFLDKMRK